MFLFLLVKTWILCIAFVMIASAIVGLCELCASLLTLWVAIPLSLLLALLLCIVGFDYFVRFVDWMDV